jgi:hypothetical protein
MLLSNDSHGSCIHINELKFTKLIDLMLSNKFFVHKTLP